MIDVILIYYDPHGEIWLKRVVINRPFQNERIKDGDLFWKVKFVTLASGDPRIEAIVEAGNLDTQANLHSELGLKRNWELVDEPSKID